ncbi:hypothetical protein [Streptomyces hayashii]|uniref:hypothetical protein n=1 Tax=Streptomyces hayashii TaxID=2839966 RepID=UPI00403D31BE
MSSSGLSSSEIFGDETAAAAIIDLLVRHAQVHSRRGDLVTRAAELGEAPDP